MCLPACVLWFVFYRTSGASQRIIKMQDMPIDPMEPPKFRHKKVPRAGGSPPVPIMHSPPRAVTVKDQQDWKIPPCISNWKNPKERTQLPLNRQLEGGGAYRPPFLACFSFFATSVIISFLPFLRSISRRLSPETLAVSRFFAMMIN